MMLISSLLLVYPSSNSGVTGYVGVPGAIEVAHPNLGRHRPLPVVGEQEVQSATSLCWHLPHPVLKDLRFAAGRHVGRV